MSKILVPAIAQPNNEIPILINKDQNCWEECFYKKAAIILDQAIAQTTFHHQIAEQFLTILVDNTEYTKSVTFLDKLIKEHQKALQEIDALVVIGGGATINLGTALAAQLCKFSLDQIPDIDSTERPHFHLILIPTSVLSMADVAYGSYGLLNKNNIKNSYRVMYDPDKIILDMRYLPNLSIAQKKQGIAECLKHALLQDKADNTNTPRLADCLHLLSADNPANEAIFACVLQTVRAKADIVQAINFGNKKAEYLLTYGHVDAEPRETASHFQLTHGNAVLLGLAVELLIAGPNTALDAISSVLPFTPLATVANKINFDPQIMLEAYRLSAKPRFRAGHDKYYVLTLPYVGYFANVGKHSVEIEMREYAFDILYEAAQKILLELSNSNNINNI